VEHLAQLAARATSVTPAPVLNYVNRGEKRYVRVLGPHWVLDHRMENSELKSPNGYKEETHVDEVYAVLQDGSLVVASIAEEIVIAPSRNITAYHDSHNIRPMTDADIQAFDFAKVRYDSSRVWGDLVRSRNGVGSPQCSTKGQGVTGLLEDLLRGRTNKLPGPLGRLQDPALESRHRAEQSAAASATRRRNRNSLLETMNERVKFAALARLLITGVIVLSHYLVSRGPGFVDGRYWVAAAIIVASVAGVTAVDFVIGRGKDTAFVLGAAVGVALAIYLTINDAGVEDLGVSLIPFSLAAVSGLALYGVSALSDRAPGR